MSQADILELPPPVHGHRAPGGRHRHLTIMAQIDKEYVAKSSDDVRAYEPTHS